MKSRLVLASRSETRLRVLRQAGFDPVVAPADVDETRSEHDLLAHVRGLAVRKACAVAPAHPGALVLGCDTLVEHGGAALGKPSSPAQAAEWWRAMRGGAVVAWTAHHVVHGERHASRVTSAMVRFGHVSDDEIDRYVATGEPLGAAGAFRLDGRAAAFVDAVEGDPGTVHGVSIPALREMLHEIGVEVTGLWV